MMRIVTALFAACLMLAGSTGCGSGASGSSVASLERESPGSEESRSGDGSSEEDREAREQQALKWAACMREHGVDLADPEFTEDGGMLNRGVPGEEPDVATMERATEACEHLQPEGGGEFSPEERAEMQDRALEFAQCMREHGFEDWPDPDISGNEMRMMLPEGVDPDDPELRAAQSECEEEVGMPGSSDGRAA